MRDEILGAPKLGHLMRGFSHMQAIVDDLEDLCNTCRRGLKDSYNEACRQVWDALPCYFEVGDRKWSKLKERRDKGLPIPSLVKHAL
jgi:hypothetical protein